MANLSAGEIGTLKTLNSFFLCWLKIPSLRVELGYKCDRAPVRPGHSHTFIPFISAPLPLGTFCSTPVPVKELRVAHPPTSSVLWKTLLGLPHTLALMLLLLARSSLVLLLLNLAKILNHLFAGSLYFYYNRTSGDGHVVGQQGASLKVSFCSFQIELFRVLRVCQWTNIQNLYTNR